MRSSWSLRRGIRSVSTIALGLFVDVAFQGAVQDGLGGDLDGDRPADGGQLALLAQLHVRQGLGEDPEGGNLGPLVGYHRVHAQESGKIVRLFIKLVHGHSIFWHKSQYRFAK